MSFYFPMEKIQINGMMLRKADYITISEDSQARITSFINEKIKKDPDVIGVLVTLNQKGCAGLAYKIEFAKKDVNVFDNFEVIQHENFNLFINPKISLYLIGTKMEYQNDALKSGFFFENPNSKGSCGCGESFFV